MRHWAFGCLGKLFHWILITYAGSEIINQIQNMLRIVSFKYNFVLRVNIS
jgi:hypothetical protein